MSVPSTWTSTSASDLKTDYTPSSPLFFGWVCEDPRIEQYAVKRWYSIHGRAARVLSVASGGDTCLSLSSQADVPISDLVGVDIAIAQIHCCRFKALAFRTLELHDFLLVLTNPHNYATLDTTQQQQITETRARIIKELLPQLPKDTQEYWNQHTILYRDGLHSTSVLSQTFQDMVNELTRLNLYPPILQNPLDAFRDDDAWYAAWTNVAFKRFPFPAPSQVAYAKLFAQVVKNHYHDGTSNDKNNWWIRQAFALPPMMEPLSAAPAYIQYHSNSKRVNTNMEYTPDGLTEHCTKHNASKDGLLYDFVNTSNCLDVVSEEAAHAMLTAIHAAMAEGGVIVARSVHIKTQDYLPSLIAKYFTIDQEATDWATKNEQTHCYKCVVIGIKTTT